MGKERKNRKKQSNFMNILFKIIIGIILLDLLFGYMTVN